MYCACVGVETTLHVGKHYICPYRYNVSMLEVLFLYMHAVLVWIFCTISPIG